MLTDIEIAQQASLLPIKDVAAQLDQLIREILRMRRHEAHAADPVHLADFTEKLRETDRIFQAFAVGIDVLSQEHDFADAVTGQRFRLPDDLARLPAPLPSPDIGDDTVTAEIVAAEHDVDAGLERVFALNGKVFDDPVPRRRELPYRAQLYFANARDVKVYGSDYRPSAGVTPAVVYDEQSCRRVDVR